MSVAALAAPTGAHAIDDVGCIAISFPEFVALLGTSPGELNPALLFRPCDHRRDEFGAPD